MRRLSLLAIVLVASTGCDDFDFQDFLDNIEWEEAGSFEGGQLYAQSRGVVIHDNGNDAHVGMSGTTCEVDTDGGWIGTDHDIATANDEVVVDSKGEPAGDLVLVTTDDSVHVVTKDDFWGDDQEDYNVPGTIDAGFDDEGIVVLSDDPNTGCTVTWVDRHNPNGDIRQPIDDSSCDGGAVSVDPKTGDAFVTSGYGTVTKVSSSGLVENVETGVDIAVWDTFSDTLYTANIGDSVVNGLEADGTHIWTTDIGAGVVSIEDAGVRQGAIVLAEMGGHNQVLFLDSDNGAQDLQLEIPGADASDIAVSNNGHNIGVIRANEVYFTRI